MSVQRRVLAGATAVVLAFGMSMGSAGVAFASDLADAEVLAESEATLESTSIPENDATLESTSIPENDATLESTSIPESDVAPESTSAPESDVSVDSEVVPDSTIPPEVLAPATRPAGKVFVCKYVGTPGVDEVLQSGNNPISVSVNAIPDYQGVGSYFADAHGRSFVLAEDTRTGGGQEGEPSVSECPPPDGPTEVTPAASATQYSCLDDDVVGGFITVDLSVAGVTYSIEDDNGDPVTFDGTSGQTAALLAGDYTVFGTDADETDTYDASSFEEDFTIDSFTELCGDLPTFPNWPASVTVTDESCVQFTVIDGSIEVVFPEGSEENPNPIEYYIDYEGPDEQQLTADSTVVPAGDYVVTAVVTDTDDSVNSSGTSAEFEVTVGGIEAEDCDFDFPTFPNWPASVSTTDEHCGPFDVVSGFITVVFPEGSEENPNPIEYYIDYEGPDEQQLTADSTVVPAGDYVVTAVVTDTDDSVNSSGTSAEFEVTVDAQDASECGQLETLAFTGPSDLAGVFGIAAVLVMLTGMGMVAARRRVEA